MPLGAEPSCGPPNFISLSILASLSGAKQHLRVVLISVSLTTADPGHLVNFWTMHTSPVWKCLVLFLLGCFIAIEVF